MSQFNEVRAWKCLACNRVLVTQKGIENHKKHCRYIPPILDGQINLFDKVILNPVVLQETTSQV